MNRSQGAVGMTLIELLMVVFILGSLVAVAVPSYRRAIEQVYFREARGLLLTIYSGQRAYFFLNDFYLHNPTTMSQWRMIHMDDPNTTTSLPVTFTVNAAGFGSAATFTATATRIGGGPCNTLAQTVNEQKTLGGMWGSCSAL